MAERIQGSDVVKYILDGMHCIAKYNGSGSLIEEYVYGANVDEVLCRITASGTWYYYHQDALQSVVAVTDESGSALAAYQYDVFGKVRSQTGTINNEILFTGRWLDETTGLNNYRARWYDAKTGRFLSRDPIGVEGGINLYEYCRNNGVKHRDPEGFSGIPIPPPFEGWPKYGYRRGEVPGYDFYSQGTGDCTKEQKEALQYAVDLNCKWAGSRKCTWGQSCNILKTNLAQNAMCAIARDTINKVCFRGGNQTHRDEANTAWGNVAECAVIIECKCNKK